MHSCEVRETGFGGAGGGGKTTGLCGEGFMLSQDYPGNRGFLGRKVGTHFKATTLQKWIELIPYEMYSINEQKQIITVRTSGRPSHIFYGGLDNRQELSKFTSSEFGWIGVDQAEELVEDDFLALLRVLGRYKLPNGTQPHYRAIFTANPRQCYFRQRFIISPDPKISRFIPSLPKDNPHLAADYIPNLRELYKHRPEIAKAMIEGSWDLLEGSNVVIKWDWANRAKSIDRPVCFLNKAGVSVDVARFGDDEVVIYGWIGAKIVTQDIFGQADGPAVAARALAMCKKIKGNFIVIDGVGVGASPIDALKSMIDERDHITVMDFQSSAKPTDLKFYNKRAEAWWEAGELFADNMVSLIDDDVLVGQLSNMTYSYSGGRILMTQKDRIKKDMGRSPDRADSCIMGLWALKRAPEYAKRSGNDETSSQKWVSARNRELSGVGASYEEAE